MSMKYSLCITIPTYNRGEYLRRLLESIVEQEQFNDDVSIVINDGPSNDNTSELVSEYQKKHRNIFYSRNEKAVGMLPAILESIDMSNGEYTRLFGSDDFMHKNALKIVLNIIRSKTPTLILSNRITFNDVSECDNYPKEDLQSLNFMWFSDFWTYFWINEENKYQDKRNYLTFMSVFCFQTNYYQGMLKYVTKNICTLDELKKHYFNYILILFSQLFTERSICVIEKPRLVFCQWWNTSWKPNRKINKDVKMLMNYLRNTYVLSLNCHRMLKRMYYDSYIFWNIIYQISNIIIFNKIINYCIKNQKIKSLYIKITKRINWIK